MVASSGAGSPVPLINLPEAPPVSSADAVWSPHGLFPNPPLRKPRQFCTLGPADRAVAGRGQGSEVAGNMLAQRTWADITKCFNDAGKASTLRPVRFRRYTPAINGRTACVFVTRLVHR